jgi:hypothetical protein
MTKMLAECSQNQSQIPLAPGQHSRAGRFRVSTQFRSTESTFDLRNGRHVAVRQTSGAYPSVSASTRPRQRGRNKCRHSSAEPMLVQRCFPIAQQLHRTPKNVDENRSSFPQFNPCQAEVPIASSKSSQVNICSARPQRPMNPGRWSWIQIESRERWFFRARGGAIVNSPPTSIRHDRSKY